MSMQRPAVPEASSPKNRITVWIWRSRTCTSHGCTSWGTPWWPLLTLYMTCGRKSVMVTRDCVKLWLMAATSTAITYCNTSKTCPSLVKHSYFISKSDHKIRWTLLILTTVIYEHNHKVFLVCTDLSTGTFRFDERGSGPARYTIFNYQKVQDYTYAWVPVGNYFSKSFVPNQLWKKKLTPT